MKVYIGPYKSWFGPYQLAEKLMWWVPKERDEYGFPHTAMRVHNFGEWLAHGSVEPEDEVGSVTPLFNRERHTTWIYRLLMWIDSKRKRKIKVRIDRWDTWSMDHTLGLIILPMLEQLQRTQHGAPNTDDEDVPAGIRSTHAKPKESEHDTDEHHFARWNYILGEMIYAFKMTQDEQWEDQFETGESDLQWKKLESGHYEMIEGPNHTKVYDTEGRLAVEARIKNGFRLFGKYYQSLWD